MRTLRGGGSVTAIRAAITQTTWTGDKQLGAYYNAAVVVGADGTVLGKYRKNHIPNLDKSWEKFYFRPANL